MSKLNVLGDKRVLILRQVELRDKSYRSYLKLHYEFLFIIFLMYFIFFMGTCTSSIFNLYFLRHFRISKIYNFYGLSLRQLGRLF